MKIGILSDTHGRADAMAAGMRLLRDTGAGFYVHCGDVGSRDVIDYLAGVPSAFVWGNTDYDRTALARYAEALDVACYGNFGELSLDGKRIALLHGDDAQLKRRVLESQTYDYLLQGHTHIRRDERIGRTRVINPGALFRAAEKTVALLDTATDDLEFFVLPI